MTRAVKTPGSKEAGPKKTVPPKKPIQRLGFSYSVSRAQLEEYRTWPYERRLKWLLMGNLLRKSLPGKTIELQEAFRKGLL
jgi:hypothetical protein